MCRGKTFFNSFLPPHHPWFVTHHMKGFKSSFSQQSWSERCLGAADSAGPWETEMMRNSHCSPGAHRTAVSCWQQLQGEGVWRTARWSVVGVLEFVHLGTAGYICTVERRIYVCWSGTLGTSALGSLLKPQRSATCSRKPVSSKQRKLPRRDDI